MIRGNERRIGNWGEGRKEGGGKEKSSDEWE